MVAFWNSAPRQLTVSCRGWESTSSSWLIYVLSSGIRRRVTQWRNGGIIIAMDSTTTTTPSTRTNVFVGIAPENILRPVNRPINTSMEKYTA